MQGDELNPARLVERRPCASCGREGYTAAELNLHHGQAGRCYHCFDAIRNRIKELETNNGS